MVDLRWTLKLVTCEVTVIPHAIVFKRFATHVTRGSLAEPNLIFGRHHQRYNVFIKLFDDARHTLHTVHEPRHYLWTSMGLVERQRLVVRAYHLKLEKIN